MAFTVIFQTSFLFLTGICTIPILLAGLAAAANLGSSRDKPIERAA